MAQSKIKVRTLKYIFGIMFLAAFFSFKKEQPCGATPELNAQIIDFVKASLNKKVGAGECWDLASEALNKAGAKWDGQYNFGKVVDYKKTCIYPGDIVQFEGVELHYNIEDAYFIEKLEHHTAIIYTVKAKGDFTIADQNTKFTGKKVGAHAFDVKSVTKGKFTIFRPVK